MPNVKYNVFYDTSEGTKTYCLHNVSQEQALEYLENFKWRYLNKGDTPKAYPNGQGSYDIRNPRVEKVE